MTFHGEKSFWELFQKSFTNRCQNFLWCQNNSYWIFLYFFGHSKWSQNQWQTNGFAHTLLRRDLPYFIHHNCSRQEQSKCTPCIVVTNKVKCFILLDNSSIYWQIILLYLQQTHKYWASTLPSWPTFTPSPTTCGQKSTLPLAQDMRWEIPACTLTASLWGANGWGMGPWSHSMHARMSQTGSQGTLKTTGARWQQQEHGPPQNGGCGWDLLHHGSVQCQWWRADIPPLGGGGGGCRGGLHSM